MTILDSNVILRIMRGEKEVKRFVENHTDTIGTTIFNVYELLRGRGVILDYFKGFEIYGFSESEARVAAEIYRKLKSSGKMKGEIDILIASIVKANGETIITIDKDFIEIGKIVQIDVLTPSS
ncbi:PIN domain-containing protein [Candidatus Marsarchaeota G2 archaeon ECH_B_SAG-C16]|jgi:predicted nucleic acid-binding protein|uniref:PIN domain-containing protein n=1 Tax=Candidatus Marsarchaeota G2 archaeon ECH_B_SAG-C16 TaxID=1978163 RepID=A0A2R6B9E1_9ARCH|nr:MAG: PIN domain-containing protein [Candidatus Marsarchaeota G2 archaeon ECH_B_SAG-C16]